MEQLAVADMIRVDLLGQLGEVKGPFSLNGDFKAKPAAISTATACGNTLSAMDQTEPNPARASSE